MKGTTIKLSPQFYKKLQSRIARWEFEVGVLDDEPHKEALESPRFSEPDLKTFAGGPSRKITSKKTGLSIGEVLIQNMERLGIDLIRDPFKNQSSEINRFSNAFLKFAFGKASLRQVENLLQAVVRNPILRGEYGNNRASTADNKGFDRLLIDTAQMFKAIKARVIKGGR